MHDPKFEKEVQRKMHDLEFVPSESVWENIERAVAPRQRRRLLAAFWWWLVPGMALLGTGIALYRHSVSPPVAAAGIPASRLLPATQEGGSAGTAADRSPAAGATADASRTGVSAGSSFAGGLSPVGRRADDRPIDATSETERQAVGESGRAAYKDYQPGLISSIITAAGIHAPRLYPQPAHTAVTGLPTPKRPWMAGFAGGAGLSSLNGSPISSVAANVPGATNLQASLTSNVSGSKQFTSDITPGLSFWAGIFAEKPLSARWSVDLGLNLHYYSTNLHTGQLANSYASTSASFSPLPALTYTAPTICFLFRQRGRTELHQSVLLYGASRRCTMADQSQPDIAHTLAGWGVIFLSDGVQCALL